MGRIGCARLGDFDAPSTEHCAQLENLDSADYGIGYYGATLDIGVQNAKYANRFGNGNERFRGSVRHLSGDERGGSCIEHNFFIHCHFAFYSTGDFDFVFCEYPAKNGLD